VPRPERLPFRHSTQSDEGLPFIDYLAHLSRGNRVVRERQLVFIQQWDYLLDHLGAPPTPAHYAERWNASISTVYKVLEEFRALFPGQTDPTAICQEIWEGVGAQQHEWPMGFVETMRVRVLPTAQAA
jgi:hypothetical protein